MEQSNIKICESCGVSLAADTMSKFNDIYCIYCEDQDSGTLATREQVRERSIKAAMRFMGKTKKEAEVMVDGMMPDLPRWKE